MTVFWISAAIVGVGGILALGALPELLAGFLTCTAILFPYYTLTERPTVDTQELIIEQRDGELYITNAPLPEHITIGRGVWEQAIDNGYDEHADGPTGPIWAEAIHHADEDRDNDGYILHLDASNVTCSYRVAAVPEDGPINGVLASWGEK